MLQDFFIGALLMWAVFYRTKLEYLGRVPVAKTVDGDDADGGNIIVRVEKGEAQFEAKNKAVPE